MSSTLADDGLDSDTTWGQPFVFFFHYYILTNLQRKKHKKSSSFFLLVIKRFWEVSIVNWNAQQSKRCSRGTLSWLMLFYFTGGYIQCTEGVLFELGIFRSLVPHSTICFVNFLSFFFLSLFSNSLKGLSLKED